MSKVFGRHSRAHPPVAVRGEGVYLFDKSGKQYLDGSSGAAVSSLGHSDPDVAAAIRAQLADLAFAHTGFFSSEAAEELASLLAAKAPEGIGRVYLVSGGSEAVEASLKLARQYFLEIGQPQRRHVISRRQSYHGSTLGALAAGGNAWRREPYLPLLADTAHIAPCFEYRHRRPEESAASYGLRAADELELAIDLLGAESVMAFIAEPVVGATAGAVPPVPGYFQRIRDICDRHGVLLIADEVMCGMGRTGTLFALEQEQVIPDIVAVAKGLGAGYQPIGAMLCQNFIFDAIAAGSGFFQHGHTYAGHPMAAAAAVAVLTAVHERQLLGRVRRQGAALASELEREFGQHPNIGDIRGRGLLMALELVSDRESKAPFPSEAGLAGKVKSAAFEAGLICYPMFGTIDGKSGDHVMLAPPFIVNDDQIGELVAKLAAAVRAALKSIL